MVDALRAAHRAVKQRGLVIDARPDAASHPRIVARGRVRAFLRQCPDADERDALSDRAVERVVHDGLYRRLDAGAVWHGSTYADLAELDAYVADSARYCGYRRGTRRALVPFQAGPFVMRRAIKFQVLERL